MVRLPMAPVTALSRPRATLAYRVGARAAHAGSVLMIVMALTMAWAVAARPASAGSSGSRAAWPGRARMADRRLPSASSRYWRVSALRHYGGPGQASGFSAIVAPGRDSAWAFGGTNPGRASTPVALHWNG